MFLSLIRNRRSIRDYRPQPVTGETLFELLEAALRAPSSRNRQPWEFVVITDPELLRLMGKAKESGSGFLENAPVVVAVLANPERSDVWIEDTAIAATYIQLAAESIGLGSCWVQIRERTHGPNMSSEDFLKEKLNIPAFYRITCLIGLGWPIDRPGPRHDLDQSKVHRNVYSQ